MTSRPFHLDLLEDLENFLNEVESEKSGSRDSLLNAASENKEYLESFFYNHLYQICEVEFSIGLASNVSVYQSCLAKGDLFNNESDKKRLEGLVNSFRKILYNRSDYLEQEYLENPQDFDEFIFKVFPNHLRLLQEYLNSNGATDHNKKIIAIGGKWKRIFNEQKR